jgi:hypothetical protein
MKISRNPACIIPAIGLLAPARMLVAVRAIVPVTLSMRTVATWDGTDELWLNHQASKLISIGCVCGWCAIAPPENSRRDYKNQRVIS